MSLLALIIATSCYWFDWIHGLHELGVSIFLMPFVVLSMGCVQLTSYWFNARKDYERIAQGKFVQTATGEGVKMAAGFAGLNFSGLIVGRTGGYGLAALIQFWKYKKEAAVVERRIFSKLELLKQHKSYVLYTTPSVFVGAFINFLYIELFVQNFGAVSAGMVSVAMTYVGAGLGMVAASISQVYYGTIASIHDRKTMLSLYGKFLGRLTLMSAGMTAMVWLMPASWVVGVLGPEWNDLIVYCRVISVWLGVWFVSSSLSFIFLRLQRQREMLLLDAAHVVIVYAGFHIGKAKGGDAFSALWGFTAAQVLSYLIAILLALTFIKISKSLH
jgi:hypothetical protein